MASTHDVKTLVLESSDPYSIFAHDTLVLIEFSVLSDNANIMPVNTTEHLHFSGLYHQSYWNVDKVDGMHYYSSCASECIKTDFDGI